MSNGKKAHFMRSAGLVGFLVMISAITQASAQTYLRTNLVSDLAGVANYADSNLVNPWGIVNAGATGPIWISNNGTGTSTLYTGEGVPFPTGSPIVVIVPTPPNSPAGAAEHRHCEERGDDAISVRAGDSAGRGLLRSH